jgi:hypothetical protein
MKGGGCGCNGTRPLQGGSRKKTLRRKMRSTRNKTRRSMK